MKKTYSGSIALTKLKHTVRPLKGKSGTVRCLIIPIDDNYFVEKNDAIYMPVRVITKDEEDDYGQHGFIAQAVDSKAWKEASEGEREKMNELPIMGNIKNFDAGSPRSGQDDSIVTEELEDDLPF